MAVILGLLIFCLGLYFLNVFFQVARLEKTMTESVTLLERYMITTYSLETKKDPEEGLESASKTDKPSPKA
jgi:hypothetical protein